VSASLAEAAQVVVAASWRNVMAFM